MVGPILVFLAACVIVAIFMTIAHSFLSASEQGESPEPKAVAETVGPVHDSSSPQPDARQPQWAH